MVTIESFIEIVDLFHSIYHLISLGGYVHDYDVSFCVIS